MKIINWLKTKIRKWLLDEEYFMGADYGFHESSIVIIKRNNKTGTLTIISENTDKEVYEQEFLMRLHDLAKKYNVPQTNIVRDFPLSTTNIRF